MLARITLVLVVVIGFTRVSAEPAGATTSIPSLDHIFVIVMENHGYSEIIGDTIDAPYINQLAGTYALATNYFAVAHPSLPNYLALVGGDTFGVNTDCTSCFIAAPDIVADRIAPSGRSWKAYMESMPSACLVADAYPYTQRHNPFLYFNDVRTTAQCSNDVPLTGLATDLETTTTTPAFAWITPNLCNDMHDCSVATGDTWLSRTVPQILNSPAFKTQNSALLITWDEDDGSQSNHVPMVVAGPSVLAGYRSTASYNHYSVMRTIEEAWGLAPLTANDSSAAPMSDFFVPQSTTIARVNAGGPAYTGGDGRVWQADAHFTGGNVGSTSAAIANTSDPTLYQTERYGNFAYNFAVPNGSYQLNLKFAEIYWTTAGKRIFNVAINGQTALANFDILAQPNSAPNAALDRSFPVTVTNGTINVTFTSVVDNAKVSAIEILSAPPVQATPATIRVNTGGPAYTSPDGRTWRADTGVVGGNTATVSAAIASTLDPTLYQSERYGNFTYTFAVPNGPYTVGLRFAEIYWTTPGKRVFNVSINGQQVLSNFDILAQPNTGPNAALDKTFPVSVANGQIAIAFTSVVDNAKASAIEIVPAPATRTNSGGPAYTGGDGRAWSADVGFTGGTAASVTQTIAKTQDQTLYRSERYGNFSYNVAVPNGTYTVVLKFAEIYWTSAGKRVFNVSINGQQVLSNFDILAQPNTGPNTVFDRAFPVTVNNGNINITFTTVVDNAKASAIEIIPGT